MSDVIYNISSGFYDSVNGDRLYSAADMNKPYKRVIADGIFPTPQGTPSTDFQVVAVSGMSVAVLAGNAMIGSRWAENTDDVGITIAGNSSSSPRIDSIFLHIDTGMDTRAAGVVYRQGTAAGTPTAPAMVKTDNITELRLADILVAPSAAIITQANITDQRGGSDCPWVAGLIQQVDTSALFEQYRAAYAEQQQDQADEWNTFMNHLARDYDISMSLRKHESTYTSTAAASLIPINIDGYDTTKDLLQVYINGIFAVEGTHYIVKSAAQIQLTNAISAGQKVHFVIYKAVMGGAQPIIPTDEQVQDAVDAYMDAHPGALVVDPELSDTSTHAIQNKAVTEALAGVNGRLDTQQSDYEPLKKFFINMFNCDSAEPLGLQNYVPGKYFSTSNTAKMVVIPCEPSTKYTVIQTKTSGRFMVITSTEYPANRVPYNSAYSSNWSYTSPIVMTTGATDKYLAVKYYDSGVDSAHTEAEYLESVMVAKGDVKDFFAYGDIQITAQMLSEEAYKAIDNRTSEIVADALVDARADVFGIRINTDGTVDRVANAVGKVNDYVIGTEYAGTGVNDFDSIYPWSDIKTCNISENSDGDKVITYEDESDFARDGSNGSVFVKIPKFFTKRYIDDSGNEIILISGTRHGGFVVEPAFYDSETGEEIEHIYVGAYFTQTGVNEMNSFSGVFPESNVSLEEFRTRNGEIYDFVTLQAIQKLMSVEFGMVNVSSVFGGFSFLPWSSSVRADGSVANTNTGNFKGDARLANIGIGNTISVATSTGQIQNRTITAVGEVTQVGGGYYRTITFDGAPVDLVDNSTMLYCTGQKTGFTDSLPYHTGRTNLNSGSTYSNQFRYRGIEGLWGTLGEIMEGIIVKDLRAYWSNRKTDYGDVTKYKRLNFPVPLQNTYTNSANPLPPQIKQMGWDFRYPTIAFPEALAAKSEQYYGDLFFSVKNTGPDGQTYQDGDEFIGISSMAWDGHEDNGLYTLRFWSKANGKAWLYGSRAILRHI